MILYTISCNAAEHTISYLIQYSILQYHICQPEWCCINLYPSQILYCILHSSINWGTPSWFINQPDYILLSWFIQQSCCSCTGKAAGCRWMNTSIIYCLFSYLQRPYRPGCAVLQLGKLEVPSCHGVYIYASGRLRSWVPQVPGRHPVPGRDQLAQQATSVMV